jgi:hypothetical protein
VTSFRQLFLGRRDPPVLKAKLPGRIALNHWNRYVPKNVTTVISPENLRVRVHGKVVSSKVTEPSAKVVGASAHGWLTKYELLRAY